MTNWSKRQRLEAVLAGELADRTPVSAWRHFIDREQDAKSLSEVMIEFQKEFDWDFVKINPRASYYGEIWGNTYDFASYEGVVPKVKTYLVKEPKNLDDITEQGIDNQAIHEQLEVIKQIQEGLGSNVPVFQTLFSPLSVLGYLCGYRTLAGNRPASRTDNPLPDLMKNHPESVHRALKQISLTLGNYVQEAQDVGADGFFYSVMGLARDGFLTIGEYEEFAKPYDLQVLEAANKSSILLHTCGPEAHPERFASYPVQAIHWADRATGNASLEESKQWIGKIASMGGVDETLFSSNEKDKIINQAKESIESMKKHPFILAPGCGLPLDADYSTVKSFREVVEEL